MLVRYAQSLDVRCSFTPDLAKVDSAVTVLSRQSSDMRKFGESRDHAFEDIVDALYANEGFGPLVEGRIRAWAEQESAVVQGSSGRSGHGGELARRSPGAQGPPLCERWAAATAGG